MNSKITKDSLENIKILAFDMDHTLLNDKGELSKENRASLCRAAEKGYHIVIATGRGYSAFPKGILELPEIQYVITSNGACIVDLHSKETIYTNLLTRKAVEDALPWIEDPEVMKEVFFEHGIYADKHCMADLLRYGITSEKSKKYILETRNPVDDTVALIKEHAEILENINLIFGDVDKRMRYWEELKQNKGLKVVSSMPFNIELGGKTTSKATALEALAAKFDLGHENIMSFGDSSNDAEMLAASQIGVAMGNAVDELKEIADYIADTNVRDGVAMALKELLGISI